MKNKENWFWLAAMLVAGLVLLGLRARTQKAETLPELAYGSETIRAEVTRVLDEGETTLGEVTQPYQVLEVRLLEGDYAGIPMQIEYGKRQVRPGNVTFAPGDKILVTLGKRPDGTLTAYYADTVRTPALMWLALFFVLAILVISGWKGLRSLLAMLYSLGVIVYYIIPQILAGADPVRVSVIGAAILLGVTLYLTYGWNLKTHSAFLGMVFSLIVTGTLAWFFVSLSQLTGYGDEDALYLMQMATVTINLRGLLLGSMMIGALGVLDDLVITQAAAVFALYEADATQSFWTLTRRALHIGQDHVAATVNTLVLAYAGSALPLLLIFTLGGSQLGKLLNFEFIAEEIVRTLVGSLGLIAAVPLTTLIAVWLARQNGRWPWLGPAGEGSHLHI